MPEAHADTPLPDDILLAAAEWFAVLHDAPDAATQSGWRDWLKADPRHAAAWRRVEGLSRRFEDLPADMDRVAAAKALGSMRSHRDDRRRSLKVLAALGVGGAAGWAAIDQQPWQALTADARTAVGEQRELRLADGTHVLLNTDTALQLRYDAGQRRVGLLRGELMVTTAPDTQSPARPWLLTLDGAELRPLGTRFSVRTDGGEARLAVFEGAVQLTTAAGQTVLPAGRSQRFSAAGPQVSEALAPNADAWSQGMLVADGLTLGEFCRELDRYQPGRLTCADDVAALRVVGAFPLQQLDRVYEAIERVLPVRVQRPLPSWVRVRHA